MGENGNANTMPPLLLDRYRVEGTLGRGGFGTVVRAFDTKLERTVAIKSLNLGLSTTDATAYKQREERFRREALAGSRMGIDQHIVAVYDSVADRDGTLYLILEYVSGGTLADRLSHGPLSTEDALRITLDAARGLEAAHANGIVHRDLKPANIFITTNGRAKIGDFGIAQLDALSGRTGITTGHPGTPLYMSPEQEQTTAYVRPSSDQYSLGLVLFEMLTGKIYKRLEPRQADTVLAQQPPGVAVLIKRMIASDSGDRYESMTAVIAAIENVMRTPQGAMPHVMPTPPVWDSAIPTRQVTPRVHLSPPSPVAPPVAPTPTRNTGPALVIGLIVLVLLLAAVGGGFVVLHRGKEIMVTASPLPAAVLTAAAPPTASFVPSPTPLRGVTTTPAPSSAPRPGDVIYQADWTKQSGWAGSKDWKTVNGLLVNDGTNQDFGAWIAAPFQPTTANYAVEAEIQVSRVSSCGAFGVAARVGKDGGYWGGVVTTACGDSDQAKIWAGPSRLVESAIGVKAFTPATAWHTYRVEVTGNTITLSIDGARLLQITDNRYLSNGQVGLFTAGAQLSVRSFKVIAL